MTVRIAPLEPVPDEKIPAEDLDVPDPAPIRADADAAWDRGDSAVARSGYLLLLELDAIDARSAYRLAWCHHRLGDVDEARWAMARLADGDPASEFTQRARTDLAKWRADD